MLTLDLSSVRILPRFKIGPLFPTVWLVEQGSHRSRHWRIADEGSIVIFEVSICPLPESIRCCFGGNNDIDCRDNYRVHRLSIGILAYSAVVLHYNHKVRSRFDAFIVGRPLLYTSEQEFRSKDTGNGPAVQLNCFHWLTNLQPLEIHRPSGEALTSE